MNKLILNIVFILSCVTLYGSTTIKEKDTAYYTYFQNLKQLEYKNAKYHTKYIKNEQVASLLNDLAEILYYRDDYASKKVNPLEVDTISNRVMSSISFLNLGYISLYTNSNNSKAFNYFSKAYQSSLELENIELRKVCLLAILEFYRQEILQSNDLYKKYLKEYSTIADQPIDHFWIILYEIIFYTKSKDLNNRFFDKIKKLERLSNLNKFNDQCLSRFDIQKAYKFEVLNQKDSSVFYYQDIIQKNLNQPFNKHLVFKSLIRLSEVHAKEKKYAMALHSINKAEKYKNNSDTLKSMFYLLRYQSKNLEKLHRYKEAYDALKKSLEIEYDLDYRKNTLQNSKLEIQLKTTEKEKKIVQLLNTNLKSEANRVRNRNLFIGAISFIVIGLVIAFLVYKNSKRKQHIVEQQHEIELQKTEKLLKEQELSAIDAMISGQEKERQRLANDLHDNLGSTLATIKLHFQHLRNNKDNPKIQNIEELYSKTDTLLEDAYQKVRTIAHEKNSGVMANQGLLLAIKNLAKKVSNSNLLVEVQDYGLEQRLDNALEITIFRMIQELITNAIKHAKATEIHISLTNHDSLLNIIVEDNGKGFDAKVLPKKEGMGLANTEKRIEHLEGTFEIDSTIGKGTNIIINIPI
ncbi:sensor histidine kinase [Aquimarina muelleri]|uniref:sensor histidine kinase n=1 Tax=Aquimarina muelleri TaxID=279356 RepID=UPI003F68792D